MISNKKLKLCAVLQEYKRLIQRLKRDTDNADKSLFIGPGRFKELLDFYLSRQDITLEEFEDYLKGGDYEF